MLVLDPWSALRLTKGVAAYHEAKSRGQDADKAFWDITGINLARSKESVPQVLFDYPDLNAAALDLLELDRSYRGRENWSEQELADWKTRRAKAAARLDMVRLMVDHELKGFNWQSPEAS